MINLTVQQLEQLKEVLNKGITTQQKVYLFGSRTKNTNTKFSDVDLLIVGKKLPASELFKLKEHFAESDFPYRVDIQNKDDIDSHFYRLIESSLVEINVH